MNRHLLLLLALSLISLQSTAQNQYENVWPRIDTFMQKQLPQSAVKVADSVYKDAQKSGGPISAMKAQLYLLQIHYQLNDNGDSAAIYEAEHYAATAEFPYKAMWQSITAQLYWNYYQSKSDEILERSNVKDNDPNFEFWDARHFFEKITALYFASLKDAGRLKKMRDADFYPILSQGKNSPLLRPTLFDLLAYRALAYFNNDEKDITESELHFTMNDPAVFDEPERFMVHHFTTKDSSSAQFRALLLYQQLLAIHIHDANKSAFVYADMERLDFANKNSVAIDKKELYIRAMRRIAVAYPDDSIAAMAQYKLAEQLYGEENDYADKSRHADKNRDYTRILSALDKLFSKFPKSEAGISARNLANKIKQKTLEPNYEKVILPDEYSRILVTYKNVPKIWVRIVPVDAYMYLNFEYDRTHFDSVVRHSSIQEFSISLPGSEDYKYHDAEVKLDPLPAGRYGIWISDNKDFVSSKDSLKSSGCFAVSSLCMVKKKNIRRDGELVVLNRKTGWPVANALVKVHDADRENKVVKMLNTGKNCFVPLPNTAGRQSYYYDIAKDNDTLDAANPATVCRK